MRARRAQHTHKLICKRVYTNKVPEKQVRKQQKKGSCKAWVEHAGAPATGHKASKRLVVVVSRNALHDRCSCEKCFQASMFAD